MKEPNAKKCMLGLWNSSNHFDNNPFDLFYREGLRFDSGSWHEEEVPNRDQMSLHSVTLLTENLIVLPVQWRLCLLSFLLPVCVLSWTCIPFLESWLSFGMILIRVFYQNSMPSITIPGDRIQLPAYLITTLIYVNSWKMLRGTNPYRKPL